MSHSDHSWNHNHKEQQIGPLAFEFTFANLKKLNHINKQSELV